MTVQPWLVGAGAALLGTSSLVFVATGVDLAVSAAPALVAVVGSGLAGLRLGLSRTSK